MTFPDIRTVVFIAIITGIACTLVLVGTWLDTRKRFPGTGQWALDYVCQTVAGVLLLLRGVVPDSVSMVAANTLVVGGAMLGYDGLRRFAGRRGAPPAYFGSLAVFAAVHGYFALVHPSLDARNLNITVWLGFVCAQCAWLALRSVQGDLRQAMRSTGLVFAAFAAVNAARSILLIAAPDSAADLYQSGLRTAVVLIIYHTLLTLLAFSVVQMVNRRLLGDIRVQEEKFSKAFHSSPYAVTLTRASDGTILEVNDGFVDYTGYARDEVIGAKSLDVGLWYDPKDRDEVAAALASGGNVVGQELRFRRKSGEVMTGLFSADVIDINGESCILSSISDITERLRSEEALREKNEELQRFAQALSHDLRSPLVTVSAYLSLIGEDIAMNDEARVAEDLALLAAAADRMSRLTDELSELSRIGRLDSPASDAALQDVVREAVGLAAGRLNERGIAVTVTDDPILLHGDQPRLTSLFLNLLDNAAKFMGDQPEPKVEIGADDAAGEIVLFVRDNGSGIEPDEARKLFAPFVRLDSKVDGSGLGLTIVKRIVEVHGGRVWVESDGPGKGATFRFTLAGTRRASPSS